MIFLLTARQRKKTHISKRCSSDWYRQLFFFLNNILVLLNLNSKLSDSTHGTNEYGYQLSTIMVLDNFGEGFPVMFWYSNKVELGVFI